MITVTHIIPDHKAPYRVNYIPAQKYEVRYSHSVRACYLYSRVNDICLVVSDHERIEKPGLTIIEAGRD